VWNHPQVPEGEKFRRELNDFLQRSSRCASKVQEAGSKLGLGSYSDVMSQTPIFDGTDPNIYNRKGFGGDPNRTLGDAVRDSSFTALGFTVAEGIYLTGAAVFKDVVARSRNTFHESLHRYFFGLHPDHSTLVKILGITLTKLDRNDPKYKNMSDEAFQDHRASESINVWIRNGCR
jgi:hypothetical protein